MKIGLLGFTFRNANKGCEALTYSFIYTMNSILGDDTQYRYYSYSQYYGAIQDFFPSTEFTNFVLSRRKILTSLKNDFKQCDLIFDISYGDGFADIYNPKGVFWNTIVKQAAILSRKPLILLPQTYGPFNSKFLERQAALAIRGSREVFSRDILSTEYIKKISGVEAYTVTDLAFSLPYDKPQRNDIGKVRVGVNVSGLLWKGGFYKDNQFGLSVNYPDYVTGLLDILTKNDQYEVHLIPHVIENIPGSNDGDLYVNELLKEMYPNVIVAPAFNNPVETKSYFAGMDVVTAARMHATVDAFSSNVPVIPFAYSRKFEGLFGSLDYNYIVDGNKVSTEEAIKRTIQWIEIKDELKAAEENGMQIVEKKSKLFVDTLKTLIPTK